MTTTRSIDEIPTSSPTITIESGGVTTNGYSGIVNVRSGNTVNKPPGTLVLSAGSSVYSSGGRTS